MNGALKRTATTHFQKKLGEENPELLFRKVVVTSGEYAGVVGPCMGKTDEGYLVDFVNVESGLTRYARTARYVLCGSVEPWGPSRTLRLMVYFLTSPRYWLGICLFTKAELAQMVRQDYLEERRDKKS